MAYHCTLSGDGMVTLTYHKKLAAMEAEWRQDALKLRCGRPALRRALLAPRQARAQRRHLCDPALAPEHAPLFYR